ncbi:unnamed protein product, partial [Porites evermanni]
SENLVYYIPCDRCSFLYIGETGRNLRSRFSEHLRSIRNNTPGFPVAQHFNSTGQSISFCLSAWCGMRLIFQRGNVQPKGLNINFSFT